MKILSSRTLLILLLCVFATVGCHRKRTPQLAQAPVVEVTPDPPPPPPEPVVVPPLEAPPPPPKDPLAEADAAYNNADYPTALPMYLDYLAAPKPQDRRDEVLFKVGLIYALASPPIRDWTQSMKHLGEISSNSSFKLPAALIVSLHSDLSQATSDSQKRERLVRQLQDENDKLKKIDADRRRRP